jgi:hypothetical protein
MRTRPTPVARILCRPEGDEGLVEFATDILELGGQRQDVILAARAGIRDSLMVATTEHRRAFAPKEVPMIRKLASGEYRLYSRKTSPKTGKRRNLGTFKSRAAAEKHEREVQYFKRH